MTDTTPAAAALQTSIQRGLTGLERLRLAVDMSLFARRLAQTRLHQEHPDWTDADVTNELLRVRPRGTAPRPAVSAGDLLRRIIAALNAAGIPHMLTGSFASAYHGSPRATQDIDFVIEADPDRLRALIRSLPPGDYYADEDTALEALRDETQFTVIDLHTGWKIDLVIRKSRPFSVEEFARRRPVELDGVPLAVATAEDIIVAKLEWARAGGSTRQVEDVASILRIRAAETDIARVERWISAFGLQTEWAAAKSLAGLLG